MSSFDLTKYESQTISQNPIPQAKEEAEEHQQQQDQKQSLVTIDGPLASAYAAALIKVYGENTTTMAQEASQQQMATILSIQSDEAMPIDDAIIHVTDAEHINANPTAAYNGLNIALDNKKRKHYVVVECKRISSNSLGMFTEHAAKNADKVFFSKEAFFRFLGKSV